MRKICPQVLGPCETDVPEIESIIINLSLVESDRGSLGFSRHCHKAKSRSVLFDDMIKISTETAKQIPSLKKMRILHHKHPSLDMVVEDCITGGRTILAEGEEWDWSDDGGPDPDDEISDEEIPSLSGSSGPESPAEEANFTNRDNERSLSLL
ncbi:hypothetical protein BJX76DRAFT_323009 [Aspergillus varians]